MKLRLRRSYRRIGDRHRAVREWPQAEAAYRRHLRRKPGDAAIEVQLGHALKEQDKLAEAADAYRRAADDPVQAQDALRHLADVLARLGRPADQLRTLHRLHGLTDDPRIEKEIRKLRNDPNVAPAREIGGGAVFLTIDDMVGYLKAHVTLSGIQRVQAGIAANAMAAGRGDVHFVLERSGAETQPLDTDEFWLVAPSALKAVIDYATGSRVDHGTLRVLLAELEETATRVRPMTGSTILLLGAFWPSGLGLQRYAHARRNGIRIGAYIYDIIPITHPEFCDAKLTRYFTTAFCELCFLADFLLTISEATRVAVEGFLARTGARPIPMRAVPLAHSLSGAVVAEPVWPRTLAGLEKRPFVAYVSTIEGRKNHLYVVNAWRRMIEEGVSVPDLVFIGRKGWRVGGLTDVLESTRNLGGRVHIAHDLSDGELNAVYERARFTVFTSFVEGWGLPIGESLVHHTPCVASNTSSMPEVGGAFVDYVDPFNLTDGVSVFKRLITDAAYLEERRRALKADFRPRGWAEMAEEFVAAMDDMRSREMLPTQELRAPPGTAIWFGDLFAEPDDVVSYMAHPIRLLLDNNQFYAPEDDGAWMRGRRGVLELLTTCRPGEHVMVALSLSIAPWATSCRLQLSALEPTGGQTTGTTVEARLVALDGGIRVPATVDERGAVAIRLELQGEFNTDRSDIREFGVGIRAVGYAPAGDLSARQDLVESFAFRHAVGRSAA